MRSVIKTRRKHVGKPDEHVNDNPDMESFTLSLSDVTNNQSHPSSGTPSLGSGETVETLDQTLNNGTQEKEPEDLEMNDPEEQLPEELNSSNNAESHQALIEFTNPNLEGDCTFRKILNHS